MMTPPSAASSTWLRIVAAGLLANTRGNMSLTRDTVNTHDLHPRSLPDSGTHSPQTNTILVPNPPCPICHLQRKLSANMDIVPCCLAFSNRKPPALFQDRFREMTGNYRTRTYRNLL